MMPQQTETLRLFCEHAAEDLELLAALHDREPDAATLEGLRKLDFPRDLGLYLAGEEGLRALELMTQALAALPPHPGNADLNELAADYASIYLNHGIQASPEESVWLDDDHLICQDSMFQVRGWLEKYGLQAEKSPATIQPIVPQTRALGKTSCGRCVNVIVFPKPSVGI